MRKKAFDKKIGSASEVLKEEKSYAIAPKAKSDNIFNMAKARTAIIIASTIAASISLNACGDKTPDKSEPVDPPKPPVVIVDDEADLKAAVSSLNKFMASVQSEKNFTAEIENSLPKAKYTLYVDNDKIKKEDDSAVSYIVNETNKLYKIFQTEDLSWHKDEAEEGTKDVDAIISQLIADTNQLTWTKYDKESKTLRVSSDQMLATACLDNGQVVLTAMIDGKSSSCTHSDVGTTHFTLPENVIDDTQTITPPDPELTEEQIIQNVYMATKEKVDRYISMLPTANPTLNKILGVDYENTEDGKSYVYFLIDTTSYTHALELIKLPVADFVTLERFKSGDITLTRYDATRLIQISYDSNNFDEQAKQIYAKLKQDNLLKCKSPSAACAYMNTGADHDQDFGTYVGISFYNLT